MVHAAFTAVNRSDPTVARPLGTTARRELLHLFALSGHIWRVNFTVRATMAGTPLRIPVLYGQGPQNLAFLEPGIFGAFERLFARRAGAFVDVGVNVGQTLLKVKVIDPDRVYVGFEINPRCCQYVEELIKVNGFARCTIVPAGLFDRNGIATLLLRSNVSADPSATTIRDVCDDPATLRRQYGAVCRGDDAIAELDLDAIAVVKIDTEGAELEVLIGLTATIARYRPFIVCEILPVGDVRERAGQIRLARQRAVQELLRAWQYDLFRLHADVGLETVGDIGVHADLALSNYMLMPREHRDAALSSFTLA